MFCNLIMERPS